MNSMTNRMTVLFDDRAHAEAAVNELRQLGVDESKMSIIARQGNDGVVAGNNAVDDHDGSDVAKGTVAGMGVGALFGIAAALIPGVGPFITAGTLLTAALGAVGGGAVAGAVVGGTTGLIASALAKAGYDEHEASYYGQAVEGGSTLVAIDTTGLNESAVKDVLSNYGARSAAM